MGRSPHAREHGRTDRALPRRGFLSTARWTRQLPRRTIHRRPLIWRGAHAARTGQPLADALQGWRGLPVEASGALSVAGATGDYTGTLGTLADLYEGGF